MVVDLIQKLQQEGFEKHTPRRERVEGLLSNEVVEAVADLLPSQAYSSNRVMEIRIINRREYGQYTNPDDRREFYDLFYRTKEVR